MPNITDYVTPIYDNVAIGPFVSPPGFVLETVWFYEKTADVSLTNLAALLDSTAAYVNDGLMTCEQVMTILPGFIADELAAIYAGGKKIMAAGHVATDPGFSYNGPPGTCPESSHLPVVWSAYRFSGFGDSGVTTYRWLNAGGDCTFEVYENTYYSGPISAADFPDESNFVIGTYYGGSASLYPDVTISIPAQNLPILVGFDYDVSAILAAWFPMCQTPVDPYDEYFSSPVSISGDESTVWTPTEFADDLAGQYPGVDCAALHAQILSVMASPDFAILTPDPLEKYTSVDASGFLAAVIPECGIPPHVDVEIYQFRDGVSECANFTQFINIFGIPKGNTK